MTGATVIVPAGPRFISEYRVDGALGQGAMGVVYDGNDPDIDRHVAIKTVHRRRIAAAGGRAGSPVSPARRAPPAAPCIPTW